MGTNGCLNDEPPCWKKQVDYFFTVAIEAVKNRECLTRAEKVAKKLDKVLIRPVIKELSRNELKQTIVQCKNWDDSIFLTAKDC